MKTVVLPTIKDKRYEEAPKEGQQFVYNEEARSVLYNYCGCCRFEMGCDAWIALARGLERGDPQWTDDFVRLRLNAEFMNKKYSLGEKGTENLPDEVITCRRFELV
jgi:hypothetical protein